MSSSSAERLLCETENCSKPATCISICFSQKCPVSGICMQKCKTLSKNCPHCQLSSEIPEKMSPSSATRPCEYCFKQAHLRCSKCKSLYYCGKKCQKKHFKSHKPKCLSLEPEVKKTNAANSILLEILEKTKLDENETEKSKKIVEDFIEDSLIKEMRKNKLFDLLFKQVFHSGPR